jgi:hypothetical protein
MATSRSEGEQRRVYTRLTGLMKKANTLFTMFGVQVAVYIRDGDDTYVYQSENEWLRGMEHVVSTTCNCATALLTLISE